MTSSSALRRAAAAASIAGTCLLLATLVETQSAAAGRGRTGRVIVDGREAGTVMPFSVAGVSQVTLTANKAAPQTASTTVTWTATPSGGTGPYEYKWLVTANGTAWSVASTWSSSNTFTWTPESASSAYQVGVWIRSAGNTADAYESGAAVPFPIQ